MYTDQSNMPGDSRIWIYQADRELTVGEMKSISEKSVAFLDSWTAHNNELKASFELRHNRFLILMIDEAHAIASGCSIDKGLHFVQQLEKDLSVSFLNRLLISYRDAGKIKVIPKAEFENLIRGGQITKQTMVFNNLIPEKAALAREWEVPLNDSWHRMLLGEGI